jgi:lycopene beta-cyclase
VPEYDHTVVGAGLSGLMLTRALLDTAPSAGRPRVLLADPRPADASPVTFAFWATGPGPLDRWTIGQWDSLMVVGHQGQARTVGLDGAVYRAVDWGRGRAELLDQVAADPRVTMVSAPVGSVRDGLAEAAVDVDGRWTTSRWVYDSRPTGWRRPRRTGLALTQAFRGLWVRTDRDTVPTGAATLMDFSADDGPDLGFTYVLPISTRSAMVMAVRIGSETALPDPGPSVPSVVGDAGWRVEAEESGTTPLVVPSPPRRRGRRVLAIGVNGGRARASTGYAVTRILADTLHIRRSLDRHDHPFALPPDPLWQRGLDRIWLHALARERAGLESAFLSLFTQAPLGAILRFLDGEAGPRDVLAVVNALPPGPFLRALFPTPPG